MVKDLVSSAMLLLSFSCKAGLARYVLTNLMFSSYLDLQIDF